MLKLVIFAHPETSSYLILGRDICRQCYGRRARRVVRFVVGGSMMAAILVVGRLWVAAIAMVAMVAAVLVVRAMLMRLQNSANQRHCGLYGRVCHIATLEVPCQCLQIAPTQAGNLVDASEEFRR